MGNLVTFETNGRTGDGYLATPPAPGPAVIVIQEWWGLVPHIREVADRMAAEGFLTLAPDLYHGQTAKSPDDAGKMLMELDVDRAREEILGAGEYLLNHPDCTSSTFGVVGFCMGGALAQHVATHSSKVGAAASFYGGFKKAETPWENLSAPLLLIYGESDLGVPASDGIELQKRLRAMGKQVDLVTYPADHAFFNDHRPESYNRDAAEDAWNRTIMLFRQHLR